ncbi:DUF1735 domain-containing protein [Rufibacter immobilis]|uniref:DUF1735 domain-containing protein n=1 Tax=Rufibacter immobilis TaxID=1348778 RepID=A0A3M9N6H4_9BACT|nr:DUF1735 domain-containing protein [Rufibacter immobilis]RNI32897.1 DUF1735 domain-containing protein [Rufibacter immobilis]
MKKFTKFLPMAFLAMSLSSCLNDEMIEDQKYGMIDLNTKKIIELPAVSAQLLPYSEQAEVIDFLTVNLAAEEVAQEDITVQLGISNSQQIIDNHNKNKPATDPTVTQLPNNFYSFEGTGLTVTIPKGSRSAVVKIRLKSSDLNADFTYGLGFNIVSVDKPGYIISGNFGNRLAIVGAQNQYHGAYTHTYTSSLGNGTNTVNMITLGANAVTLSPGLLGVYSNAVTLNIDPITHKVTVSMTTLLPIATDPSSHYDPATKTFHLKWTSNGGARTFEETFVKK